MKFDPRYAVANHPAITKAMIHDLTLDDYFIILARRVGEQLGEHKGFDFDDGKGGIDYKRVRNVMSGFLRDAAISDKGFVIYDPPIRQEERDSLIIARFYKHGHVIAQFYQPVKVYARCRLVTGSPNGKRPYSLVVDFIAFDTDGLPSELER